jgi:hypothetical protein
MAHILAEHIAASGSDGSTAEESLDEVEEGPIKPCMMEIREEAVVPSKRRKTSIKCEIESENLVFEPGLALPAEGLHDMNQLLGDHLVALASPVLSGDNEYEVQEESVTRQEETFDEVDTPDAMDPRQSSSESSSDEERAQMIAEMRKQINEEALIEYEETSSSDDSLAEDLFLPTDKQRAMLQHMMSRSMSISSTGGDLQPIEELKKEEEEENSSEGSFDFITQVEVQSSRGTVQPSDGSEAPEIPEEEVVEDLCQQTSAEKNEMWVEMDDLAGKSGESFKSVEEITMEQTIVLCDGAGRRDSFEVSVAEVMNAKQKGIMTESELSESLKSEELREAIMDAIVEQIKRHQKKDIDKVEVKRESRLGAFIRSKIMKNDSPRDTKGKDNEEDKTALEKKLTAANETNAVQAKKIEKLENVAKNLHDHIEELERIIAQFNSIERSRSFKLATVSTMTDVLPVADGQVQHQVDTQSVLSQKDFTKPEVRHVRSQSSSPEDSLPGTVAVKNVLCQVTPSAVPNRHVMCQVATLSADQNAPRGELRTVLTQATEEKPATRNVTCQALTPPSEVEKKSVLSQVEQKKPEKRQVMCQWSTQPEQVSRQDAGIQFEEEKPSTRSVRCQCGGLSTDPSTSVDRILEQSPQDLPHQYIQPGLDEPDALLDPEGPDRWRRLAETEFSADPSVLILQKSLSNALLENDTLDQKLQRMHRENDCKKMEIERRIMELQEEIEKAIRGKEEERERAEDEVRRLKGNVEELERRLRNSEKLKDAAEQQLKHVEGRMEVSGLDDQKKIKELEAEREQLTNDLDGVKKTRDRLKGVSPISCTINCIGSLIFITVSHFHSKYMER